jgi:hypothetical protein
MVSKWLMIDASAHIPLIHVSSATLRGIWKLAATFGIHVFSFCSASALLSPATSLGFEMHFMTTFLYLLFERGDDGTTLKSTDLGILEQFPSCFYWA